MTLNKIVAAARSGMPMVLLAGALALPAYAQETATIPVEPVREEGATELDAVEVTGSRIRGSDLENAQPLLSISRADIERTGVTSLGDVLSKISTAGSALNTNVNNGGVGSVFVDLRSLGPQRTLVLVNGRRWVNDAGGLGGSVDFNTIPISVVERVEVLKDGASSIYGSDAIGGVINVITKKEFSGATATSQIAEFTDGDGRSQTHSLTIGSNDGKTSSMIDLSYTQAEPVFAGARAISAVPAFGANPNDALAGASSTNPCGVFRGVSADGTPLTLLRNPNDRQDCSGVAQPATTADFENFNPRTDGYNFAPINYLVTPSERIGFFGSMAHQVADFVNFNSQILYNNRKSAQVLAETPLVLGSALGDSTVVSANNPFNPFGVDIGDDPTEGVQRRLVEAGGRVFEQDVQTYYLGAGFNGTFDFMDEYFYWDVGYIYSRSINNSLTNGQVNLDRVQQAVGDPGNCTGTEAPDPCQILNLFGPPGSITPEMLSYILVTEQSRLEQEVRGYTANVSGPIFQLPAGPLGLALGYEQREETGSDTPDALVNSGATSGNARKPTNGGFKLNELFAEFAVPLLADKPYVQRLDLSLASRFTEYEINGVTRDVTKSKAGLQYRPIDGLLLRASFAEGFRVPSITELFGGRGDSFPQLVDPCSNDNPDRTQTQIDNCVANGVPADDSYQQVNTQIKTTVGGEPTLDPEEAESIIYGFVYDPEFIPGMTVSFDVYRYELENAITALDAQTILDGCANTGNPVFCGNITRNEGGFINSLIATNVNIGGALVKGFDAHVDYKLPALFDGRFGEFKTSLDVSYIDQYTQFILDGNTGGTRPQNLAGRNTGDITTLGGVALPRVKANSTLNWALDKLGASYTLRYIKGQQENCSSIARAVELVNAVCFDGTNQDGNISKQHTMGSTTYHDVQLTYSLPQYKADLAFGVNNLFDKTPPVSRSAFANSYDSRTYDVPGVLPYARVTVNFN